MRKNKLASVPPTFHVGANHTAFGMVNRCAAIRATNIFNFRRMMFVKVNVCIFNPFCDFTVQIRILHGNLKRFAHAGRTTVYFHIFFLLKLPLYKRDNG